MYTSKFFISLCALHICIAVSAQRATLDPSLWRVGEISLCNATQQSVEGVCGLPERISYGSSDISTLDGGINDSSLSSTVFYYSGYKVYFYTYEISQWLYQIDVTSQGIKVHVGEGLDFQVGDSIKKVLMQMQGYLTPAMSRKINRGNYNLTFRAPSQSGSSCQMSGFLYFFVNDQGIVSEIKIGMLKNG